MSTLVTAALLIALPIAFNAAFALLAVKFDYPDILRRPTGEILERFRRGGSALVPLWWAFAMTALLLAPLAVLLSGNVPGADSSLLAVGTVVLVKMQFCADQSRKNACREGYESDDTRRSA
ncbi:MAG: hypothetical protein ABI255_11225 [Microbacteriaceae bacterium]